MDREGPTLMSGPREQGADLGWRGAHQLRPPPNHITRQARTVISVASICMDIGVGSGANLLSSGSRFEIPISTA